jgi:PAS domain S-box-containing protein
MLGQMGKHLAPPVFEDEEQTRVAEVLNTISLTVLVLSIGFMVLAPVISPNPLYSWAFTSVLVLSQLGALFLMRRGRVRLASQLLSTMLWLAVTVSAALAGGVRSASFGVFTLIILIAGLLLGWRGGLVFIGLSIVAGVGMLYAEAHGLLPSPLVANTSLSLWVVETTSFVAAAAILYLAVQSISSALQRARRNERALAQKNRELEAEIAGRARVEKALRESEERWRMYIEQADDLIFTLDATGRITSVNEVACNMLGYAPEEMLDKSPLEFVVPGSRAETVAALSKILSGESVEQFEIEATTKDGRAVFLEVRGRIIIQDDRVVETFHIARDVTERKRAEEALRQRNEELGARNEELDAFAHTVAHDLQNPLGLVIGLAESLEQEWATMPAEHMQHYLRTIAQNSRKMSDIIDELLLLASVRSMDVEVSPLDMGNIVDEAMQRVEDLIQEHQAEITLPETWPVASAYGPWVEEVWVNYLSNAIKYGGQPPRVELGAAVQPDGMVRFWVGDNGPGLTPEEQARLFVPFTQLAQLRVRGYGLGLSIVRRIVNKLGGQVGVESDGVPGRGSLFFFTLPGIADQNREGVNPGL